LEYGLSIKNPEVLKLVDELARHEGVSKTEVVRRALADQLAILRKSESETQNRDKE
jgi:hypothetical protein